MTLQKHAKACTVIQGDASRSEQGNYSGLNLLLSLQYSALQEQVSLQDAITVMSFPAGSVLISDLTRRMLLKNGCGMKLSWTIVCHSTGA